MTNATQVNRNKLAAVFKQTEVCQLFYSETKIHIEYHSSFYGDSRMESAITVPLERKFSIFCEV